MRICLSFLLICTVFLANARRISPEEAQNIATEFFRTELSLANPVCRLAQTSENKTESQPFYIFNAGDNDGFIIISGDTRAKKILGYSKTSSFNIHDVPPQLNNLLREYGEMISSIPNTAVSDISWERKGAPSSGGVILETPNWGQSYPYNAQCPIVDGIPTLTGCTATAMAIALKYHNWPPASFGTWHWGADFDIVDYNFNTTFDWDNMLNEYDGDETDTQIQAVSALMLDCGISVDTDYDPYYGSSAWGTLFGPSALLINFRCHPSCRQLDWYHTINGENYKAYYSYDEWTEIIRNEINSNRPIIYSAYNNDTLLGHMFVCDGYDTNDMFHFNFGWNGAANGYYAITAILPDENNVSTYPNGHRMIIGIQPEESESETPTLVYIYSNACDAGLKIFVDEVKQNVPFEITLNSLSFSRAKNPNEVSIGCALTDGNGNIIQVVESKDFNNAVFTVPIKADYMLKAVCKTTNDPGSDWVTIPGWGGNNKCSVINTDAKRPLALNTNNQSITIHSGSGDYQTYNEDDTLSVFIGKEYTVYLKADNNAANYHLLVDGEEVEQTYVYEDGVTIPLKGWYIECNIKLDNQPTHVLTASVVPHSNLTSEKVYCPEGGSLQSQLQGKDLYKIGTLCISGEINQDDFNFAMLNLPELYKFDASEAFFDVDRNVDDFGFTELYWMSKNLSPYKNHVLQSLSIPSGPITISDFQKASHLNEVVIPVSVSQVYGGTFVGDWALLKWVCLNPEPPIVHDFNSEIETLWDTPYWDATLYVPTGSRDKYRDTCKFLCLKKI